MDKQLLEAAIEARTHAYAPYSRFQVGAAVRTKNGLIFTGCNVENSSYGATVCAERNAIFAAIGAGERTIEALCVVADTKEPVAPCGICRQVMLEFKIPLIYLANMQGELVVKKLEELMPYGFDQEVLEGKE